jgi:hypothetical protein
LDLSEEFVDVLVASDFSSIVAYECKINGYGSACSCVFRRMSGRYRQMTEEVGK